MGVGQHDVGQASPDQRSPLSPGEVASASDRKGLREEVGQAAEAAVEQGRQFVDSARAQATGFLDKRKDDTAQSVSDFANTLRDAFGAFDDRGNVPALVQSAAQGL